MSVIIQSAPSSTRTASACGTSISLDVPPALTGGDVLVLLVAVTNPSATASVTGSMFEWRSAVSRSTDGSVTMLWLPVASREVARSVLDAGPVTVTLSEESCMTAFALRVTGADPGRFLESSIASVGSMQGSSHLTVPSLDPEHRRDNVLLFFTAMTYSANASEPYAVVARAAPVLTATHRPSGTGGGGEGEPTEAPMALTASLYVRTLDSADPTGEARVSATSEPQTAFAGAFMIRSANTPPEVSVPASWAGEVGRQVAVSADVFDADRTYLALAWTQVSGPATVVISNVYSRTFEFTPPLPGIYEFELMATDVDGGRSSARTRVVVPTGSAAPVTVLASEGWEGTGGGAPVVADLGDANDNTYISTKGLPEGKPLTLALPPIFGAAPITVNVRGVATNPSPPVRRTLTLTQGDGTVIAERTYTLDTRLTTYSFSTTRNETALITDRSALRLTIIDEVG